MADIMGVLVQWHSALIFVISEKKGMINVKRGRLYDTRLLHDYDQL
jgi:hypothetical protein